MRLFILVRPETEDRFTVWPKALADNWWTDRGAAQRVALKLMEEHSNPDWEVLVVSEQDTYNSQLMKTSKIQTQPTTQPPGSENEGVQSE